MDQDIFRSIFVESPIGMVMMSREGTILTANRAFLNLSGKPKLAETNLTELIVPEDLAAFKSAFGRLADKQSDYFSSELRYRRSEEDGERWVRMNIYPVDSSRRNILVGFFEDVSGQKHLEAELRREKESSLKARKAAERETRIKSDFLANMSHEIRTPIHTITGMSELLRETMLDPEQQEYVDQIVFSADVLLSLINDILDFSKIEAGKLSLESIAFDLQKMTEEAVDLVALEAHKKGLDTAVYIGPEVPTLLKGDPVRLRQIIINLFNNAVKFTKKGEVVVEVEKVEESEDDVRLKFLVHDTGIGIPDEKQNKLFKVFSQVDSSTTRKYGGTGLGLSISKNLCRMMQGDIGVVSKEGEGSTFWFHVLLKKQKEAGFFDSLPANYFRLRVLVVDDNTRIRRYLGDYLKSWGCTVTQAPDGPLALKALREAVKKGEDFDICLVDLLLPGMDGWQFASEVHADECLSHTELILMSPTGKSADEAKMKLLHWFRSYLSKPVKKGKLFEALFDIVNFEEDGQAAPETGDVEGEAVDLVEEITGGKFLIAEDHEVNQQLFKTILENLGHEVHIANNGLEAVKAVQSQQYDLIFMDVQMPEMNGYEATRAIREMGIDTPILAVTASALKGEEEKSSEVGMNDFLIKPFKKKDLLPLLEKWFDEKNRVQREAPADSGKAGHPEELEELEEIEELEELGGKKNEGVEDFSLLLEEEAGEEEDEADILERLPYNPEDTVINLEQTLETFMGQQAVVTRVIKGFLDKVETQLPLIDACLQEKAFKRLREEAHSIKGGALNLEAIRLGKTAAELERAAHEENGEVCAILIKLLHREFELFQEQCIVELELTTDSGN